MSTATILKGIDAEIAKLKLRATAVKQAKQNIDQIDEMLDRWGAIFTATGVTATRWGGEVSATFGISITSLQSFKDENLFRMLEEFESLGFEFTSCDYPANLNRDFTGRWRTPSGVDVLVSICGYVKPDSPTCRRIVTGSRQESVKTYEIVCD